MKRMQRILFSSFVLSFFLVLTACDRSSQGTVITAAAPAEKPDGQIRLEAAAAKTIHTDLVGVKPAKTEIAISGKVQYDEDRLSRISSPIVGRTVEIKVKLGEQVAKGDILMTIDSADINSAYADYFRARSDLAFSQKALDLAKDLYESKAIARKDLQQANNEYMKAETEFNRSKSRLLSLHVQEKELDHPPAVQSRFYLKSPLSGTIIEKNVTLGQTVGSDPAQNLFTVADLSTVAVVGEIFEKDISEVELDQEISITVDAYPDLIFHGKIDYIGDLVDPVTRTIKIRGKVKNPGRKLKPEMFARISIEAGDQEEGISIPQSALFNEGKEQFVFVALSDQTFRRSNVTLGAQSSREAHVVTGLKAGDRIVTEGGLLLKSMAESNS
ncbi:MAG TPA: efflux RND transporter periplasmic adaptor subunit [Candidatus Manganitrophaceae bacterium]|nr:efflux RND transporter periplasmic adaptor subunit [Candidatus Manganitrophaceae bacterium]